MNCLRCSAATDATYGLCECCVAEQAAAIRTSRGLDPTITDPTVLARVAAVARPHAMPPSPAVSTSWLSVGEGRGAGGRSVHAADDGAAPSFREGSPAAPPTEHRRSA